MNFKSTHPHEMVAKVRPDEKNEAPDNARLRGSYKKLSSRGKRKSKRHGRRR